VKSRTADILRHGGFGALLCCALVRVMTAPARTPYWDADPLSPSLSERLAGPFESTLTPALGLTLDAIVWLAAAAAVAGAMMLESRLLWRSGVLVGIGVLGVALHGFVLTPYTSVDGALAGDFRSLVLGSAWASAMVGAWAMLHLARDPTFRRTGLTVLLGVITVLVGVGALQYFLEHQRTVEMFEEDRAAVFARHGIHPESQGAKDFERRLRQPEATGWFGLANVYASFGTACFVGWLALSVGAWRRWRAGAIQSGHAATLSLAAFAGAFALWLSGSKGGAAAALLGVLFVAALWLSPSVGAIWRRWGGPLAIGLVALTVLAIVARGMVGERIGELSLLFRWHYISTSARIFLDQPLFGVGPAEYKAAYALFKPAVSPEVVESPHSLLFDWTATLGVFGLGFALAWLGWVAMAGAGMTRAEPDDRAISGVTTRVGVLAVCLGALIAWRIDWRVTSADELLVRLVALGAWIGLIVVGNAVMATGLTRPRLAAGAAALTLAVHAQIEVTPVLPGSASWLMLLIGLAAAPGASAPARRAPRQPVLVRAGVAGSIAAIGVGLGVAAAPAWLWQSRLRAAAGAAMVRETGRATPGALEDATRLLLEADEQIPSVSEPLDHAARLRMNAAMMYRFAGRPGAAVRAASEAVAIAQAGVERRPRHTGRWASLGALLAARHSITGDDADLAAALEAWEQVAAGDPHGLTPARNVWELARRLGRRDLAATWAARALEIDEALRLDPLKRLDGPIREAMRRDAAGPG